jgi:hypothetical protein
MMHYAVHIKAPNDCNGNPRRGWLVYLSDGVLAGFLKDDMGDTELYAAFPDGVIVLCSLNVPAMEYRTAINGPLVRKRT